MSAKGDPDVPEHNNPFAIYSCSESRYKQLFQMMTLQGKWDQILELSGSLIQEMSMDLNNYVSKVATFQEVDCCMSDMFGVPGFCTLKC